MLLLTFSASLLLVGRACGSAANPNISKDGWIQGRATFYGGADYFVDAYSVRGEGSFGDTLYGSCGLYEQQGNLSVRPQDVPYGDQVAAVGVLNADFPGSCGRCYEVRCRDGVVLGYDDKPVSTSEFFVLEDVNSTVKDTQGRSFPGNPGRSKNEQIVKCWNASESIVVSIIDSCPAVQIKEGEPVPQRWCLGDQWHMDLSFYMFEALAHPVYGVMGIEARPVSCYTNEPLPILPGFTNKTIYGDRPEAGWRWNPFFQQYVYFWAEGAGIDGTNATCVSASPGGGLNFGMPNGTNPGFQPFANATTLSMWVTPKIPGPPPGIAAPTVPPTPFPVPLKVGLYNQESGEFCDGQVELPSSTPVGSKPGDYLQYSIPLTAFRCENLGGLASVDTMLLQSIAGPTTTVQFCVDQVVLK